jgi:Ti-type conjugative transfer relaxase TraA
MIARIKVGKGVTGAVRYVFGQGRDPKTNELKPEPINPEESRVDWFSGQNFGFRITNAGDAELARRVMEFDALNQASRTRQCEQDCVHLSLSWKVGENPSRQVMEEAARDALKALGMENAKALFVAHNDEDHPHIHIIASKINPATGRAYDLAGSYRTLSKWAQDYELAHGGILCTRREGANELRDAIANRDADAVLTALTKQRATFTDGQLHLALEKEIIGPARGKARVEAEKELVRVHAGVLARPQLVELAEDRNTAGAEKARRFTTTAVLEAEHQVILAAADLAGNLNHGVSDRAREKAAAGKTMSDEQAAAFIHATLAGGFAIIDGQAGTGKSYTIAAVREAYEASGCRVIGLAPTNAVAGDMRADGFQHAATIHSELFALNNGRRKWDAQTVVIVDEAAMLDTKLMAMVTSHAADAKAKLILVGDDRQLSSIDHGGMFAVLKDRHGCAELTEVKRQQKNDERRASEMFASGNFHDALNIYNGKGAIHWTRTQREARAELIDQWTKDSASAPEKTRFVFAYTNADVDTLNAALRDVRRQRGELGDDHQLATAYGRRNFAAGDRVQFNATEKTLGIVNGAAGTVESIDGSRVTVKLDGRQPRSITFDAGESGFNKFRHGYAGTIYKGQGRTLDQTYLYHSEHWRSASSYVAMTRHRDKAELFVARNTAADVKQLARQMGRTDDRRAASMFEIKRQAAQDRQHEAAELPRLLSPAELLAQLATPAAVNDDAQQRNSNAAEPAAAVPPPFNCGERQAGRYDDMDASHRAAEPPAARRAGAMLEIVRMFNAADACLAERTVERLAREAAEAAEAAAAKAAEPAAAHRGEREAGHYGDMDASHRAAEPETALDPSAPAQRILGRAAENITGLSMQRDEAPPEIVRVFDAAGMRTTEPAAENFDRDAAEAEWQAKVDAAGIDHDGKRNLHSAPTHEPLEPIIEDTYPPPDPTEARQQARARAGTFPPGETPTAAQPPEIEQGGGILRPFARAAETLAAFLFGNRDAEPITDTEAERRREQTITAEREEQDVRLAETLGTARAADAGDAQSEEQEQTRQRKRGLSR